MPTVTEVALLLTPLVTVGGTLGAVYLTQRGDRQRTSQQLEHDRKLRQEERDAAAASERRNERVTALKDVTAAAAKAARAARGGSMGETRGSWEPRLLDAIGELSASAPVLGEREVTEQVADLIAVADQAFVDAHGLTAVIEAARELQLTLNDCSP